MTRYLLDTHIFIWSIKDKKLLSRKLCDELENYNNLIYLSSISLLEIAIKNRDGDLSLGVFVNYRAFIKNLDQFGIEILDMAPRHLITLNRLTYPQNHKDPFDHLIISQAITDRLCLISADGKIPYYRNQGLDLLEN